MSRTVSLAFRTREELNAELESLAATTQRSKSWHIEQALEIYLERQSWEIERIKEGLADAEAGRTVPHEEVEAWVRSLGTDHEQPLPQSRAAQGRRKRA